MSQVMGSEWIGLTNFTRFFESPLFVRLIKNALALSLYSLVVGFPIPIEVISTYVDKVGLAGGVTNFPYAAAIGLFNSIDLCRERLL